MGSRYKVLGQAALAATTLTDVYTCPYQAVISSIVVCNRSGGAVTVRIGVAVAGAAGEDKQYLYYDKSVAANDSATLVVGITLGAGDVIRAYAASANISVNVFGAEIT